nr:MAG TPA: hypothetical protein [Caudoviricetes sp.]
MLKILFQNQVIETMKNSEHKKKKGVIKPLNCLRKHQHQHQF